LLGLFGGVVMSQPDEIRAMIATMLMVSAAEVSDGTSLAALNTSLGSAKVRLGLRRLGLALPVGATPATFGGLLAALSGEAAPAAAEAAVARPVASISTGSGALQVGLDVEDIGSLPVAADYWEHEFYRGTFAKSEIAYAVLQAEPRTHFAGFWCAKEALRKCDPAFRDVSPERTAVAHDGDGRPYLTLQSEAGLERLDHALSISHAADIATAVVVKGSAPAAVVVEVIEPLIVAAIAQEGKKSRGLAWLFGI
jgi:phosphopantetheine--protein transferase-like protein